ncbi:MAG TPA: PilZ domain-containing protein [Thermoanaerobaculia bacterium]|nr:PilZ domain-containing protein [Thermoanaerobaculia bacterium]HUM29637.1 PilZ domain-containing protein [Thermoanaerobaculia bacterium]HXK67288.1 PilZ domain-containing protein [Thermoanaerobaculia bacterium]
MDMDVLVVGVPLQAYERIRPSLESYAVQRTLRAEEALNWCASQAFRAVVVSYPLYTMPVETFLEAIRASGSRARNAAVVIVAFPGKLEEAEELKKLGIKAIVPMDGDPVVLHEALESFTRIANRVASRIMVRLLITQNQRVMPFFCKSENISSTGLYVSSESLLPLGTRVEFQFMLPWDKEPIRGVCEVARHAVDGVGRPRGMGFRFIEFENDAEERLQAFLGQKQ